jgi:hypothetical protein
VLVGIAWTSFTRGQIAKLGLVDLVWSVTPKPVKVAAAGVVVTWVVVAAGALARDHAARSAGHLAGRR